MAEPFDPHSKSYYRRWFEKRQVPVESEYESFLRARKIDLLVRCDDVALGRLQDTCFAHFRHVNSVEFKGVHDPLTLADFKRIQMRSWGVGLWHKPHASENEATESLSDDERELECESIRTKAVGFVRPEKQDHKDEKPKRNKERRAFEKE